MARRKIPDSWTEMDRPHTRARTRPIANTRDSMPLLEQATIDESIDEYEDSPVKALWYHEFVHEQRLSQSNDQSNTVEPRDNQSNNQSSQSINQSIIVKQQYDQSNNQSSHSVNQSNMVEQRDYHHTIKHERIISDHSMSITLSSTVPDIKQSYQINQSSNIHHSTTHVNLSPPLLPTLASHQSIKPSMKAEHRYVVVLGPMGVGKSTFIRRFLDPSSSMPEAGDQSKHLTNEEQSYRDKTGQFILMDTVGLDHRKHEGVSYNNLMNKDVAFILLLNSRRWEDQRDQFLVKLGWKKDQKKGINVYLAFDVQSITSDSPLSIVSLTDLNQLDFRKIVEGARRTNTQVVKPELSHSIKTDNTCAITKTETKTEIKTEELVQVNHNIRPTKQDNLSRCLFNWKPVCELNQRQKNLHTLIDDMASMQVAKQKQMKMEQWQLIDDYKDVISHRFGGDLMLKYFLKHIYHGELEDRCSERITNASLNDVAKKLKLTDYINHLAGTPPDKVNNEIIGDYLEALFEIIWTKHPTYLVDFLRHIMGVESDSAQSL